MAVASIPDIIVTLQDEADRLELTESLRLSVFGSPPDAGQLRRANRFKLAADMLAKIEPLQDDIRRLIAKREARR